MPQGAPQLSLHHAFRAVRQGQGRRAGEVGAAVLVGDVGELGQQQLQVGPVVAVANEFSGSDGDIVNAAIKALGIGPVVGTRTWGGVIGIDSRYHLVDGTLVTQPKYAIWLEGVG
ncbi:S41 family peptidase, partial [Mycobacterium bouchedurhonense]|uniref:S41 family peptidase n=1 Tax=Mycobacterium bouchedurhonense TaxID=701041 RepID=UPI00360AB154